MGEVQSYIRSKQIRKIYSGAGVLDQVRRLFNQHPVSGVHIFDLFLVATMLENGVTRIYTYNTKDFDIFSEIEILTPPEPQLVQENEEG